MKTLKNIGVCTEIALFDNLIKKEALKEIHSKLRDAAKEWIKELEIGHSHQLNGIDVEELDGYTAITYFLKHFFNLEDSEE